jgi:hypothetical protein
MADGWSITVCSSDASKIGLQSGKSKDDNIVWGEWKSTDGTPKEFTVPEAQKDLDRIFVQLNNPDEKQCEVCLKKGGTTVKHFSFDGKNENQTVNAGDRDECPC